MTPAKRSLDPTLVEEFRARLLAARARLFRTVAATDEELATLESHHPGGPVEDAAREEVVTILSRLGDRERRELEEISAAWAKIEDGTFGLCEACGQVVALARLRAVPAARYCLACQASRERQASPSPPP